MTQLTNIIVKICDLETPCLLLNKPKVQANIDRMQDRLDEQGVVLRAHGKTAKNIDVIRMLRPEHRQSITVSTLKEAEYFFESGIHNILYAVGITPNKLPRVARLLKKGAELFIVADSLAQVLFTAQFAAEQQLQIPLLIEIDCDDERAGIRIEQPEFVEIAQAINASECLLFKGLMTHAGGAYHCATKDDIIDMAEQERVTAVMGAEILSKAGVPCQVVSIGSTPTAMFGQNMQGITEVRAGVFMFSDLVMAGLGVGSKSDIGLSVLTAVIGQNPGKNWLLVDAGWMALSRDRGTASQDIDYGYGQVCGQGMRPISGLKVNRTNQEHGIIECAGDPSVLLKDFPVGRLLSILPNHACATAAMHDRYYVTEDGKTVSEVWQRINGW